ncbi:bZIP transcription factor [Spirosoma sp. RP8]|uniref:BZIP transcription factor n=1 Tax=Spirosoma liriopis TaxID=2937440 RepID=A0ABT0HJJ3_9BACT|nr:bZIP transcription factor [Spirosoma liriopis]MCK8492306.1 bZIP transcription factor [Spirosoma liriopis]
MLNQKAFFVVLISVVVSKSWAQNNISFINGNTFLGYQAGRNNQSGSANVFIGSTAGYNNSNGIANLFLGQRAGYNNSVGAYNTFIGSSSGENNSVGANNNFIGNGAGLANTEGNFNVFIGSEAGAKNKRGGSNVHIGSYAGRENLEGSANTFIGHNAGVPAGATLNNVTVLGYNALATASNSVILGSNANVGIGTSAPNAKLEITQGTAGSSGLRFTNLTSSSTATALNQTKFLTVNAQGDVVLGSLSGSGRLAAEEGQWKASGDNLVNTNAGGVVIGPGVSNTPAGYRLYVADGVLTEKVKVAVKSTTDWSDRVFESGYRLRGLKEVERYINREKHLPGVPSAEEVVKEGNDLHRTDALLLEKIEELTLYTIQLQKSNVSLQKKVYDLVNVQKNQRKKLAMLEEVLFKKHNKRR